MRGPKVIVNLLVCNSQSLKNSLRQRIDPIGQRLQSNTAKLRRFFPCPYWNKELRSSRVVASATGTGCAISYSLPPIHGELITLNWNAACAAALENENIATVTASCARAGAGIQWVRSKLSEINRSQRGEANGAPPVSVDRALHAMVHADVMENSWPGARCDSRCRRRRRWRNRRVEGRAGQR